MDKISKILDDSPKIEDYLPENWYKIHNMRQELGNNAKNSDLLIPSFEHCLRKNLDDKVKNFKEQIKKSPQYDVNSTPKAGLSSFLHRWNTSAKLVPEPSYPSDAQKFDRVYHNIIKELETDDNDLYKLHRERCTISDGTPKVAEEAHMVTESIHIPSLIAARTVRAIINSSKYSQSPADGQSDFSSSRGSVANIVKSDTFKFKNTSTIHGISGRSQSIASKISELSAQSNISHSDFDSIKESEHEEERIDTSNFESQCSPTCDTALSDFPNNEDTHNGLDIVSESDDVNVDIITPVSADALYEEESVADSPILHSLREENHTDLESDLSVHETELDDLGEEFGSDDLESDEAPHDQELEEHEEVPELDNVNYEDVQESNIVDLVHEDSTSEVEEAENKTVQGTDPTHILEQTIGASQFELDAVEPGDIEKTLGLTQESIHSHCEDLYEVENTPVTFDYKCESDVKVEDDPLPEEGGYSGDSPRSEEKVESEVEETNNICTSESEAIAEIIGSENNLESLIPTSSSVLQDNELEDSNLSKSNSDHSYIEEAPPVISLDVGADSEHDLDEDVTEPRVELIDEDTEQITTQNHTPVYTDSEDYAADSDTQNSLEIPDNGTTAEDIEEYTDVSKPNEEELYDSPGAFLGLTETLTSDETISRDDTASECSEKPNRETQNDVAVESEIIYNEIEGEDDFEEYTCFVGKEETSENPVALSESDSESDRGVSGSMQTSKDLSDSGSLENEDSGPEIEESDKNLNVYGRDPLKVEESGYFGLEGSYSDE